MLWLWRYPWFRTAAYGVAWAAGRARHLLFSGWLPHMIGLAAVGGVLASRWTWPVKASDQTGEPAVTTWTFVAKNITWTFVAEVAVIYALLWLVVLAYRGRERLTVLATVNYAGKDFNSFAAGLPAELANELGRLSTLYKITDEANPPASEKKEVSELKVGVDTRGELLANVVGEKSAVKLGPLDVPLRPLVAAVERLVPRRRLSTSLHRTGNRLTLLAEMPGVEANWRVERPLAAPASAEGTAATLSEMREELIYRVAAEMVPTGSKEWEAVKRFSEGLRAYRRARTTDRNIDINLRDAEDHFFTAHSLDKCFWRCSYNLGVVYRERGKRPVEPARALEYREAAKAAFEQAIKDNPTHADAAYALSLIHLGQAQSVHEQARAFATQAISQLEFEQARDLATQAISNETISQLEFDQALEFAERVITNAPRDVRAWTMKGYAWRLLQQRRELKAQWPSSPETDDDVRKLANQIMTMDDPPTTLDDPQQQKKIRDTWGSSLKFREKAAALAWRDLCRAVWQQLPLDGPRQAISHPFKNLAVSYLYLKKYSQGVQTLHQAIWQLKDASLHFELGKGCSEQFNDSMKSRDEQKETGNDVAKRLSVLAKALDAYQCALHLAQTKTERARYHAYVAETWAKFAALHVVPRVPEYIRKKMGAGTPVASQAYERAYENALASPSSIDKGIRDTLTRACNTAEKVHRCSVIECIGKVNDALEQVRNEKDSDRLTRIEQAANDLYGFLLKHPHFEAGKIVEWGQTVYHIDIAAIKMGVNQSQQTYEESACDLEKNKNYLEKHFPAENWLSYAIERLAEALRLQGKLTDALPVAEKAVALDPFSSGPIRQLGLVHFGLANYDQAEQELRRSFALDPSDTDTLKFIGNISWIRGVALTNREDRRSEFKKVIETFNQAVDLAKTDRDRGELHFNLGQFHSDLKEYDLAAKHYAMAKALNAYPIECRSRLGFDDIIEQELYDQAERHLRDALWQIFELRQAAQEQDKRSGKGPKSPSDWWRTPLGGFYEGKLPPGYFLLNIWLLLALVSTERGGDIKRAKRRLGFVDRHMHFLGEPSPLAERDERVRYEVRRREITARYKDYLGWVYHLDDKPKKARKHIEASVKLSETPESLCHLARVYLDKAATDKSAVDRALEYCDRAKKTDIRGVFAKRIEKIEADAKSLRGAADAKTSNDKKDAANARAGAGRATSDAP